LNNLSKALTSKWHVNEVIHFQIKDVYMAQKKRSELRGLSVCRIKCLTVDLSSDKESKGLNVCLFVCVMI